MIIGHCGWGHVLIPNIKRVLCSCYPWISSDFISFRNTHRVDFTHVIHCCYQMSPFVYVLCKMGSSLWALSCAFLKVPPPPCLQEAHNKWRQTQEAGRAAVLWSYFSSLLHQKFRLRQPPQAEQLCQLLDRTRKATGRKSSLILTLPPSSKNSSFNYFPYIYPISSAEYLWR